LHSIIFFIYLCINIFHVMYSTYKNIILKRLKYIIAGLLLITILPGNTGVKKSEHFIGSSTDISYSEYAYPQLNLEISSIPESDIAKDPGNGSGKAIEKSSDPVNHYIQKAREISPTGRSFNFFLSVQ
jgi:hypothetical protein